MGIDDGLVFLEKLNRFLRLSGIDVDGAAASAGAAHHIGHIIQMVDLIHTAFDAFESVHRLRDVAGHRHAPAMGFIGNGANDGRCQEGVQLDLLETGFVVAIHDGAALLWSLRCHMSEGFDASGVD